MTEPDRAMFECVKCGKKFEVRADYYIEDLDNHYKDCK